MRIALVILITDLHLGGSPLVVRELARGLGRTGRFAVEVVSVKPLPGESTGGKLATIPAVLRAENIPVFSLGARRASDLAGAWGRLVRHVRVHRPEVVLSVLVHANLLAVLARPFGPRCVWIQSIHTLQARPRWHWVLQRWLTGQAEGMIVPAAEILERLGLRGWGAGVPAFVVPNGIDMDRFAKAEAWPSTLLPWPPQATTVGYIGRFDPVKNLPVLMRAFAAVRGERGRNTDLHLVLIGHGPQEGELRRLAGELGIGERAHFLGPTNEPERYYKCLSIFCLPSEAEGFGLAALEALAAGCRVILADTPVLRHVGGDDVDYVKPVTVESLAHVISEVTNKGKGVGASAGTLERLRREYSVEGMVRGYAEKLEKVLQASQINLTASGSGVRSDK